MSAERRNSKLLRTRRDRHKEHSVHSRQEDDEGVRTSDGHTGKELRYSFPGHTFFRRSYPESVTASVSAPDPSADPAVLLHWLRATEAMQPDTIQSRTFSTISSTSSVNSTEHDITFGPLPGPCGKPNGHAHEPVPPGPGRPLLGLDLVLQSGYAGDGPAVTPMSDSVFDSDTREPSSTYRRNYPSGDYEIESSKVLNCLKRSSETEPLSPELRTRDAFKFSHPHLETHHLDGSSSEEQLPAKPEDIYAQLHDKSPNDSFDNDDDDDEEEEPSFTILDIFANLYAIFMYLFDIGSDIYLAALYYNVGEMWLFALTATLVLIPALTVTAFSFVLYIMDHRNNKERGKYGITTCQWFSRFMFLFLQCGLVLRYIDTLIYGFRSRIHPEKTKKQRKHWYREMLFEEVDSCMLRLYECFLEAAPQLMLQLYVMLTLQMDDGLLFEVARIVSCVTSLCSIAWSLASYHRALRLTQRHTAKLSIPGFVLQLVWHFLVLGARILALSLFAAFFPLFAGVVVLAHWCVMFAWVLTQGTRFFEPNRCREVWFNVIMAAVYTFAFVNLVEGHSRLRYTVYYVVVYAENTAMALAWYAASDDTWYTLPAMLGVFVVFPLGIAVQAVYYLYWHPNNYPPWSATKSIPLFREPERWMPRCCLRNRAHDASTQRVQV